MKSHCRWDHPILSADEARSWEHSLFSADGYYEAGSWAAMQRAGEQLARAMRADFGEVGGLSGRCRVLMLAGKGHNAGDGFLALLDLARNGIALQIDVVAPCEINELRPLGQDALRMLIRTVGDGVRWRRWSAQVVKDLEAREWDLCLDGLLGMGFCPPIRSPFDAILQWANVAAHRARLRVAIDLPSGNGEPGCFTADICYATGICKEWLTRSGSILHAGRIRYLNLGFFSHGEPQPSVRARIIDDAVLEPLRGPRNAATDKRSFGHLLIIGGSTAMPGAVAMCALGAVRSGAGLVSVATPEEVAARVAGTCPEVMWVPLTQHCTGEIPDPLQVALDRADALLIGPGMLTDIETRQWLANIAARFEGPIITDASALFPDVISAAQRSTGDLVLTPHYGEFTRISENDAIDDDALIQYSSRNQAIVVLKGAFTRICSPDGRILFCPRGGPVLARGGSGDILAGVIGSQVAAAAAGSLRAPTAEVVARAVYWHAKAGDFLARANGANAVRTTDLLDFLAPALRCNVEC